MVSCILTATPSTWIVPFTGASVWAIQQSHLGFGLFSPGVVIWTLPLVNVLAVGAGNIRVEPVGSTAGSSTWLGLAFCLNPGVLAEVDISGGGAVALAFCVWGVLAAEQGRLWTAAMVGLYLASSSAIGDLRLPEAHRGWAPGSEFREADV